MLKAIIGILFFMFVVIVVGYGASALLNSGNEITLLFGNQSYSFSPLYAIIILALILVIIWFVGLIGGFVIALIRTFLGDENAIKKYFSGNRSKKANTALTNSLIAIATNDAKSAEKNAHKAERYMDNTKVSNLLNAQAARMNGNTKKATEYYKRLVEDDDTRFVGVQGLLEQKLDEGDTDTAMKLAEKAIALEPTNASTLHTLFSLQTEQRNWVGARQTLEKEVHAKLLPKDVGRRRDAVLSLASARDYMDNGDITEGKTSALQAIKLSPGLAPAAVLASEIKTAENDKRHATKILKKAWAMSPNPDLAAAFADIEPDETPNERLKRFKTLIKTNPNDIESKLLSAELNVAADNFEDAKTIITEVIGTKPSARAFALMAAVERAQGDNDALVRGWLAKALEAPRGPRWVCTDCNEINAEWGPTCEKCKHFDTLIWKESTSEGTGLVNNASMLPVIIGAIEGKNDVPNAETVPEVTVEEDVEITGISS